MSNLISNVDFEQEMVINPEVFPIPLIRERYGIGGGLDKGRPPIEAKKFSPQRHPGSDSKPRNSGHIPRSSEHPPTSMAYSPQVLGGENPMPEQPATEPNDDYWPIEIPLHVTWGDMDALGHANNTRFIGWFEETRFEVFRRIGRGDLGPHSPQGPILAKVECVFRAPVVFPEELVSAIRACDIGEDRYTLEHRITSVTHDRVVAIGSSRIIEVNYASGEKIPLSAEVRSALQKISR